MKQNKIYILKEKILGCVTIFDAENYDWVLTNIR